MLTSCVVTLPGIDNASMSNGEVRRQEYAISSDETLVGVGVRVGVGETKGEGND